MMEIIKPTMKITSPNMEIEKCDFISKQNVIDFLKNELEYKIGTNHDEKFIRVCFNWPMGWAARIVKSSSYISFMKSFLKQLYLHFLHKQIASFMMFLLESLDKETLKSFFLQLWSEKVPDRFLEYKVPNWVRDIRIFSYRIMLLSIICTYFDISESDESIFLPFVQRAAYKCLALYVEFDFDVSDDFASNSIRDEKTTKDAIFVRVKINRKKLPILKKTRYFKKYIVCSATLQSIMSNRIIIGIKMLKTTNKKH